MRNTAAPQLTPSPSIFISPKLRASAASSREPYLKIMIWQNLPQSAPYTVEVRGGAAAAIRCLKAGACEAATSGSLHLDKFVNEKISAGEYELHFRDGSVEKGSFDATWCHIRVVCG